MTEGFLVLVNAFSFAITVADKIFANENDKSDGQQEWRVPEKWFYNVAAIGGWAGGAVAMLLMHHKTAKKPFLVRYAAAAALHMFLLYEFDLESKHFGKIL